MPTILTPQGWVKVAAPAPRRRTVAIDPVEALKGPLAYFSCKRAPPKVIPGAVVGGSGAKRSPEAYPYDLDASPERLRAQGRARSDGDAQIRIGGKYRTVSAPVPVPEMEMDEEREEPFDRRIHSHRGTLSSPKQKKKRHASSHTHSFSGGRYDDGSSLSSGSSLGSSSSSLGSSSTRSHDHHRRHHHSSRPVDPTPTPTSMYTPHSSFHRSPAPQQPYRRSGYYDNYTRPPSQPAPPSSASGRGMSYNWYNATTPLNI